VSEFKAGVLNESEAQWRQYLSTLYAQSTPGVAATGVVSGLGVAQTATASASIIVGLGSAVVQTSLTTGVSPLLSNADKTIDVLTGSPVGGLPRNDLVIFNGDTASIQVVIGTPNASPTDPTPSTTNHIKLARIRNAANATSIPTSAIDDLRVFTTLGQAVVPKPVRVPFPLQGDQQFRADFAPASWVVSADGTVRGEGVFAYTTGQASVQSRLILAANIPASVRATVDPGKPLIFSTVGSLGAFYGTIRHDINPYTGEWKMYRADAANFSWTGGDMRISLNGIAWNRF